MLYSLIKSLPFTEFLINTKDEFELVESYRMMLKRMAREKAEVIWGLIRKASPMLVMGWGWH